MRRGTCDLCTHIYYFPYFYGHVGFLLMAACSGVYIWVPYYVDTPVPLFDPFLEFTTTLHTHELNIFLCTWNKSVLRSWRHEMHSILNFWFYEAHNSSSKSPSAESPPRSVVEFLRVDPTPERLPKALPVLFQVDKEDGIILLPEVYTGRVL